MFDYDAERLRDVLAELIRSNISPEAWMWLQDKLAAADRRVIHTTFSLIPRKTGHSLIAAGQVEVGSPSFPDGFSVEGWTADRLCRVYFLMHIDPADKGSYFKTIEDLFLAAEMSELAALYSALPVLAWPELWKSRCAEGVRSNIGTVLEAIMYHNPYPARYLDEKAWNQLVMKAFFTDKDVTRIYGLEERANAELSLIVSDYMHERWAAGRKINPLLWRLVPKFIDRRILGDLERALKEGDAEEKEAAREAILRSGSGEAKLLLKLTVDNGSLKL